MRHIMRNLGGGGYISICIRFLSGCHVLIILRLHDAGVKPLGTHHICDCPRHASVPRHAL